ncbi:MAG: phosphoserine phosphatase SerB [Thermoprotei archaeon]
MKRNEHFQLHANTSRNRWIVFDVEGVLVDGEYLVGLANLVGLGKVIDEITRQGLSGEVNWDEGLIMRLKILNGKINKKMAEEVAWDLPLMKGAKETCAKLKELGFNIAAVTGGFQFLADRVKKELELDIVISNKLFFDSQERISGILFEVSSDKAAALMRYINKRIVDIAVVDGANDLTLFNIAKTKIAFNAAPIVELKADISIKEKDLSKIFEYLKF